MKSFKNILYEMIIFLFLSIKIYSQPYFGGGVTKSWSYNFGKSDINFSYINPDNASLTKSWIEYRNFKNLLLFMGYNLKQISLYHDIRFTVTSKGAISLHNKQDFLFDPIILELHANNALGNTASRFVEIGVRNHVFGLTYGLGKSFSKYFQANFFLNSELVCKKRFIINWYDDPKLITSSLYSKNTYVANSFKDDYSLDIFVSNYNLELGFQIRSHIENHLGINFAVMHSLLPSIKRGSNPNIQNYTYWEENSYITAAQLSLQIYISKK
jgi:hypothetical protein